MRRHYRAPLAGMVLLCLMMTAAYQVPAIRIRLESAVVKFRRFLNPPEAVVFTPEQLVDAIVAATLTALAPAPSQTAMVTAQTGTPLPSFMPSPIPTSIPLAASLTGIRHEYQQFNNCAPASLSMVLSYWGWTGSQFDARPYLRPGFEIDDKNVNPFEIVRYVKENTAYDALWRVGGDLTLLRQLLAAGFPVLIEKGLDPHDDAWLGHYQIVSGYDDSQSRFLVYDSYEGPPEAWGLPYDVIAQFWRHFNFAYVVVFPPERAPEVQSILGPQSDPLWNFQYAADLALAEAGSLEGREHFFAWFNRGTSLVHLQEYAGAAEAYDTAFTLYAGLPAEERPWRLLWYQDGPYAAYYHTGRYQDVVNLAHATLVNVDKPVLEETYYWRGMARAALGDQAGALEDLQRAARLNPNSTPAAEELLRMPSG